eukprot:gene10270-12597_t
MYIRKTYKFNNDPTNCGSTIETSCSSIQQALDIFLKNIVPIEYFEEDNTNTYPPLKLLIEDGYYDSEMNLSLYRFDLTIEALNSQNPSVIFSTPEINNFTFINILPFSNTHNNNIPYNTTIRLKNLKFIRFNNQFGPSILNIQPPQSQPKIVIQIKDCIISETSTNHSIFFLNNSNLYMQNFILSNHSYIPMGLFLYNTNTTILDSRFTYNYIDIGSPIFMKGGKSYFYNSWFHKNQVSSNGTVYIEDNISSFDSCHFSNNFAQDSGGSIYYQIKSPGNRALMIFNSTFSENFSKKFGGSVYIHQDKGIKTSEIKSHIQLSKFTNNIVSDPNGQAGSIYCFNVGLNIRDSIFIGDTAYHGGSLYLKQSDILLESTDIRNNNLLNYFNSSGGAVYSSETSLAISRSTIMNNIAYYGSSILCNESNLVILNSTIQNNTDFKSIVTDNGLSCNSSLCKILTNGPYSCSENSENDSSSSDKPKKSNRSVIIMTAVFCSIGVSVVIGFGIIYFVNLQKKRSYYPIK